MQNNRICKCARKSDVNTDFGVCVDAGAQYVPSLRLCRVQAMPPCVRAGHAQRGLPSKESPRIVRVFDRP